MTRRGKKSHPCTFKNDKDEDFIHLSYGEDRLFAKLVPRGELTYSLRRAFAWYNIKLDGDRILPLGHGEGSRACLGSVTISPELSACRLGMDLNSQGCSNTIRGKEPQDCNNPLAAACCWMLYWRRQKKRNHEPLPVSQHLLEYRQRVLCHLNLLDSQKRLAAKVRSLVLASSVYEITTLHAASFDAALHTTQMFETVQPQSDPPLSSNANTGAKAEKPPVRDRPLSAQSQSLLEAILEQLRSGFACSSYVQRHANLYKQNDFIDYEKLLKLFSDEGVPHHRMQVWYCHWINGLTTSGPFWSPLEPQPGQSTKGRIGRDFYSLIPSQLKAELESAVQSWASDPDEPNGNSWNGHDGTGFLACVALALTDWDSYELRTWQPHDDLQTVAGQVSLLWGQETSDRLRCLIRDFTTGILEKGLYLPPSEHPVSRLFQLREKGAVVYML
jgi:hypothetical protein